ncbi:MAG: radical SAM protein [Myxococcales bacterium]|nr:radical SAM protein [Myxococcales bacterium]
MIARLHDTLARSRANGPGTRMVVWFQGCTLGCAGCFNPATHAATGPGVDLAEVVAAIGRADVDGLTLSGGEPMQQAPAALELLLAARRRGLSTLMFSGYARAELTAQALGPAVLAHLDVLIDGRYRAEARHGHGLRGSANQAIHLLTGRHTLAEVEATPEAEVTIAADGTIALTGVAPLTIRALR